MRLNAPNGLTIREFKKFLEDLPESDKDGNEHTIWMDPYDKHRFSEAFLERIYKMRRELDKSNT